MTCSDSDEPWPLAADFAILNAPFTASRNYFSGALSPPVGRLTTAPAFYSTAPVVRDQSTWWLLAAVDGQVHLLDGATEQVVDKSGWAQRDRAVFAAAVVQASKFWRAEAATAEAIRCERLKSSAASLCL